MNGLALNHSGNFAFVDVGVFFFCSTTKYRLWKQSIQGQMSICSCEFWYLKLHMTQVHKWERSVDLSDIRCSANDRGYWTNLMFWAWLVVVVVVVAKDNVAYIRWAATLSSAHYRSTFRRIYQIDFMARLIETNEWTAEWRRITKHATAPNHSISCSARSYK